MDIRYSKNTIGCRIGDEIYIHPKLVEYPLLFNKIIEHEKSHTNKYSLKDLFLDFFDNDFRGIKIEKYKFMLKHPRTFIGFFPISKVGPHWTVDINLAIFYIVFGLIGSYIWRNIV